MNRLGFLTVWGIIFLLLMVIPPALGSVYDLSFLILILMNIIISSSWNILGGFAGYSNFGHGVFFGIGAYVTALSAKNYGVSFLAIPLGCIIAAIVAITTGYPTLRLRGIYFALGTIPINYVFMLLTVLMPFTGGPEGILLRPIFSLDPLTTETIFYELFLVATLTTIFISYKSLYSKLGIGLISIREDEEAARTLGVQTTKLKLIAYSLSAATAAIAGGLYALYTLYIDPTTVYSFSLSLFAIGACYLGGRGTILGPVIGSTIVVFLSEYLRYSVGIALEGLHLVIFGGSLVLVILFVPEGIVGWLKRKFLISAI